MGLINKMRAVPRSPYGSESGMWTRGMGVFVVEGMRGGELGLFLVDICVRGGGAKLQYAFGLGVVSRIGVFGRG